ncbi:MAG: gamma-glutamyltransferase [Proteobacteria bacterium]|nr:gamma-glutamyltransferase [Pseudomonadota bacterium]
MRHFFHFLIIATLVSCSSSPFPHINFSEWERQPECCQASGTQIAIASGGTFSSKAGKEIRELGGNLVDVAVATAFTIAVERPHSLGLGGGGFLLLSLGGKSPQQVFVDFRETAPQRAKKDMYLDALGKSQPDLSRYGILSVATPGFVPGLYFIHQRWGKLSWRKILEPAIRLARNGFPVYPSLAKAIREEKKLLFQQSYVKNLLSRDDRPLGHGDLLIQSDLADTLERVSLNPQTELKTGKTATQIAEHIKNLGGIVTLSDLASYQPKIRKPLTFRWGKKLLLLPPPPSAGGILTIEMLQMLTAESTKSKDPGQQLHLLAEIMKRAYADRSQVIGDPDFTPFNLKPILGRAYGISRRKSISLEKATPAAEIIPTDISKLRDRHTTHISILDEEGNGASMTLTINDHFGSRIAVPGTGIFLNDEMDDFSIQAGTPNLFGLVGGKANSIEPLKRPASSMTPTLVLENNRNILAIGAAGGSRITSHVFQVLLGVLENPERGLKSAVFAPRIHHQWIPDELSVERGFEKETLEALKQIGHSVVETDRTALVQAVFRDKAGNLEAVFDPRDEGGAEAK